MRVLITSLTLVSFSCLIAAAQGATKEDLVTADTFIALCDGAKKTVDAAQLKTLLAKAQAEKPKAEKQQAAAEAEASATVEALSNAAVQQGLAIQDEIAALRPRVAAANAELARINEIIARDRSGPAFETAFRDRPARLQEFESLRAELAAAEALNLRLASRIVDVDRASGYLAKAEIILSIIPELGVARTFAFAGPVAKWTAAKVLATAADATVEAAKSATECVSKKLATIDDAKAEEAKFLRNNLIRIGKDMQAKGDELNRAKKAVESVVGRMFAGATDAQINAAVDTYWRASDQFLQIGAEFQTEVAKLAGKGIPTEPWMTQLNGAYLEAKKIADQGKAKRPKR